MIGIIIKRIFAISWIMLGLSMDYSLEICSSNSRLIPLNLINTIEKYEGDVISYTITSGENNIIMQGFFDIRVINSIQTQHICLPFDTYTIQLHSSENDKINERIGLVICNTKFISFGEYGYFENSRNGCIPRTEIKESILPSEVRPMRAVENKKMLSNYIPTFSYNSVKFFSGKGSISSSSSSVSVSASYSRSTPSFSSHQTNKLSSDIVSYKFSAPLFSYSYHSTTFSTSSGSVNNILTPSPTTTPAPIPLDTNNPTLAPIPIITSSPTIPYTLAPTMSFTSEPTLMFTQIPTLLSTPTPTYTYTITPTLLHTLVNTLIPTTLQTLSPTTQSLPIAEFTTSLVLSVSSNESYDSQTTLAICTATTTILNIEPDNCNYQGTSFSQNSRRLLFINLAAVHTYTATSILTISVQTSNPGAFFSVASTLLSSAASSGTFTTTLLNVCQQLGVTGAITTASVIGAVASGLNIIGPPTIRPTYYPSIISNSSNISAKSKFETEYIIIGSIMAIFGSFVILSGLYYYHYYRTDGSNKYTSIYTENENNIANEIDDVVGKIDNMSGVDDIIEISVDDTTVLLQSDSNIELDAAGLSIETDQLVVTVD